MSQQSLRQASIRAVTGTTHTYEGDWHALFTSLGIAAGDFNGRMLQYINTRLSSSYTNINSAMAAMAAAEGVSNFQSIGTFNPGGDATAPTITSANSANNAENSVLAHALTANESVTWTITGGADAARFEISGSTLRWASNGTKDYEAPNDADTNNTYVVQVTATDTATNATNQTITITVIDVADTSTTWNPADKAAGITLSGSDLTASSNADYQNVRAVVSASSGKKYWEITYTTVSSDAQLGAGNASANMAFAYIGGNIHGVGWHNSGFVMLNGAGIGSVDAFASGNRCDIALDLDNMKVWFRVNGGNWNADVIGNQNPATNTGGRDISGLAAGPYFAMAALMNGNQLTANFGGSAYAGTPPSGFGNW